MRLYELWAKGLFWNLLLRCGGYAYILSMVKGCVRAVNWSHFFVRAITPSMDRDWRGSIPPPSRYHTAIGRARPDPEEDPGDPHTRSLTHWPLHPRDHPSICRQYILLHRQ